MYESTIRQLLREGRTYQQISDCLIGLAGSLSFGLSERSVRRFCASRNLGPRSAFDDANLVQVVSSMVSRVGPSYGRRPAMAQCRLALPCHDTV